MKFIPIKNNSEYVRDSQSNAIIRTNAHELNEFNFKRARIIQEAKEKEETKQRIAQIESDINCIKKLIQEMANIRSENVH